MLALKGVYENGIVKLEKPLKSGRRREVIVTFLEEASQEKTLSIDDFSFKRTRKKTSKYNFSLSEAVIEERKEEI